MTDGLGSVSYSYDQLSRMSSETRIFTGIGSFTSFELSYEYNLAGELKKLTDSTGMTINYGYDSSGKLAAVTGSGNLYANISNYASNFQYRAWGGLKAMTDGTNRTVTATYNSKLQPMQFDIGGNVAHQTYDYYNDSRISFVHNTTDGDFDRSYSYDHVGRIVENKTGGDARGDSGDTPYHETFAYNSFNALTSRSNQGWNGQFTSSDTGSYTNDRRDGWGYDADGRNISIGTRYYAYDARGDSVGMSAQQVVANGSIYTSISTASDAEGNTTKETTPSAVTYYLRSTVLNHAVVEEINANGQKLVGFVYARGVELASQSSNLVTWKYSTPAATTQYRLTSSSVGRTEFDPIGADVSPNTLSSPPDYGDQGDVSEGYLGGNINSRWGDFFNPSAGCRDTHGVMTPCDRVRREQWYKNPGLISAAENGWVQMGARQLLQALINYVQDSTTDRS